jgi:hypothetical protein
MLRHAALVRTDISEECVASIISVQELVTAKFVPISPIFVTLVTDALCSSETSVLTRTTRRKIPEDDIFRSHSRKKLNSYIKLTDWAL